jgi:hypothetical protein
MRSFFTILFLLFISLTVNAQVVTNTHFMGVSEGTVISYGGNWINTGLPNIGLGTVVFNGSAPQTITGATTWDNLVIDNPAGVTVTSGNQYIYGILYPTSGTLTTNDSLTLLSESGRTALIAGTGAGAVSGNVTMQRYMAPDTCRGYQHFSSPFSNATLSQFRPYMDLIFGSANIDTLPVYPTFFQYYDVTTSFDNGWFEPFKNNDTTQIDTIDMHPMVGYTANFGSDSTKFETVSLTGTVNNGALAPINLNYTGTGSDGWNFVGNPYPSPIDWNVLSASTTNVINGFSIYNATGQYAGYYGAYDGNSGVSTHNATNLIPSMRGFFVETSASGGSISFTNAARTLDLNPQPYFTKIHNQSNTSYPVLHLYAVSNVTNSIPDDLIIYFDPNANGSTGIGKLWNPDIHIPNFYSINSSNANLAINGLKEFNDTTLIIPLGLSVSISGSYKIYAGDILNFSSGSKVYLQDKIAGVTQDLTQNPNYSFTINSGDPLSGRFYIMFSLPSNINEVSANRNDFTAWALENEIDVNYYGNTPANINIYNMLGQTLIHNYKLNKGINRFSQDFSHGYYLIQVNSGDRISNKKIYINNY